MRSSIGRTQPDSNISKEDSVIDLAKKKGSAKATVAASSKLLKICYVYWIMKEKREYTHTNNNNNNDKIERKI